MCALRPHRLWGLAVRPGVWGQSVGDWAPRTCLSDLKSLKSPKLTIVKYHFTPDRTAIIHFFKNRNGKYGQGGREFGALVRCRWNVNGADAVGNGMAVPQKVNTNLSHPAIPLAGVLPEELKAGSQVVAYSCP